MRFSARWLLLLALGTTAVISGCAGPEIDEPTAESDDALTRVTAEEIAAAQRTSIEGLTFDTLTPTTERIMRSSRYWMEAQDESPRFPKPRMCATNVSKVLFLSKLTDVDQEGVRMLIADVRGDGGKVVKMPRRESTFAAELNVFAKGALPAGTIVAGMNVNTSNPGDQHVGFVGHTDPDGTVWLYHNNWYRPENEGGARKPFMVSEANLRRGFERQWMATPWLRLTRDASGKVTGVKTLIPAIDDMDPFNSQYQVTLALLPESVRELGL